MIPACVRRVVSGLALAALLLPGCGDVNNTWEVPTAQTAPVWTWRADPGCRGAAAGPFRLAFSLDGSFRTPHGGQGVRIAVIRSSDHAVVAATGGEISASGAPSFTFPAGAVLEAGGSYEVRYWIDANAGGGTQGECDPGDVDHQGSVELPCVCNDKAISVSHSDALTEEVCGTFD